MDPQESYILRLFNYVSTSGVSINTAHVKREEFKSIHEMLNPKWKGKISLFDPTVRWGDPLRLHTLLGAEFVKRLYVDQKPVLSRDQRQLSDWLGRGIYPISYSVDAAAIVDMKKLGLPVEMLTVLDAPMAVSGGNGVMALMNRASHPNAARIFVNWISSREGLELLGRASKRPTTRADIDDESYALPWEIPQPGVKYFDAHSWETVQLRDKWTGRMRDLLKRGTW